MKKIYKKRKGGTAEAPQHGYFRRLVSQLFLSWIKRQSYDYRGEFEKISGKLRDIEDSIEIMAREMARKAKRDNR